MGASHSLGWIFQGSYLLGCVLSVCWVRRRNLFGPMVQPPLILAAVASLAVLLASGRPLSGGLASQALAAGTPLITNFTTLAATTVVVLVIGLVRIILQRKPTGTVTA